MIPLSFPGLLTVVVFSFALTLHEFIYALAFISSRPQDDRRRRDDRADQGDVFFWQSLMAAAVIVAIPVAFLYNLFLDRLVAGLTLGP